MDFGIILPTMPEGANAEGIKAAAETAERLGWQTAWTTDHLLVPEAAAPDYGTIYEAILTLAWVAPRFPRLRLGTSVVVVPLRNAVVLAKELATLDALDDGRTIVGVGVGWNQVEFSNVGELGRYHRRGRYLDETMRLWRHLWSGSGEPFAGEFFRFDDFTFGPLPPQGAGLPIIVGGRAPGALRRAGALGDGYHSSSTSPAQMAERLPAIRAAAEAANRPMPSISARVRVTFGDPPATGYAIAGNPDQMLADLRAWAALGTHELAFAFGETDAARGAATMERFDREVLARFREEQSALGR